MGKFEAAKPGTLSEKHLNSPRGKFDSLVSDLGSENWSVKRNAQQQLLDEIAKSSDFSKEKIDLMLSYLGHHNIETCYMMFEVLNQYLADGKSIEENSILKALVFLTDPRHGVNIIACKFFNAIILQEGKNLSDLTIVNLVNSLEKTRSRAKLSIIRSLLLIYSSGKQIPELELVNLCQFFNDENPLVRLAVGDLISAALANHLKLGEACGRMLTKLLTDYVKNKMSYDLRIEKIEKFCNRDSLVFSSDEIQSIKSIANPRFNFSQCFTDKEITLLHFSTMIKTASDVFDSSLLHHLLELKKSHNADINIDKRDVWGNTVLDISRAHENIQCTRILIANDIATKSQVVNGAENTGSSGVSSSNNIATQKKRSTSHDGGISYEKVGGVDKKHMCYGKNTIRLRKIGATPGMVIDSSTSPAVIQALVGYRGNLHSSVNNSQQSTDTESDSDAEARTMGLG